MRYGTRTAIHRIAGVTGKLRDRGRFFITAGARGSLALLLGESSAAYKECNPEILWAPGGWGSRDEMVRRSYQTPATQSRTEETEEIMGRTFIAPGVKDVVRRTEGPLPCTITCTTGIHVARQSPREKTSAVPAAR